MYGESADFPDNLFPIISSGNVTSVANILIRILPAAFQLLPDFSVAHDPELLTEAPTLGHRVHRGVPGWRDPRYDRVRPDRVDRGFR